MKNSRTTSQIVKCWIGLDWILTRHFLVKPRLTQSCFDIYDFVEWCVVYDNEIIINTITPWQKYWLCVKGVHRSLMDSRHKAPVMRSTLRCYAIGRHHDDYKLIYIYIPNVSLPIMIYNHFSITMTSWWVWWRFKSPPSRLFTQPFIQAQIKENIKAPRHWPLWGEFTGDRWISHTKGQ